MRRLGWSLQPMPCMPVHRSCIAWFLRCWLRYAFDQSVLSRQLVLHADNFVWYRYLSWSLLLRDWTRSSYWSMKEAFLASRQLPSGAHLHIKSCVLRAVLPGMSLQEHAGSEKSWVWHAADFADGELKDELFAIRFGSVESK